MSPVTTIKSFEFTEVIVPAHDGVINSETLNKPLHMLPVGGKKGWSIQFDQLPKLIVKMTLENGIVGIGEFYRDHNWTVIEDVCEGLIGTDINHLSLQDLPVPLCREYDGFECVIWDAFAKLHDMPLYQLLGGRVCSTIINSGTSELKCHVMKDSTSIHKLP